MRLQILPGSALNMLMNIYKQVHQLIININAPKLQGGE